MSSTWRAACAPCTVGLGLFLTGCVTPDQQAKSIEMREASGVRTAVVNLSRDEARAGLIGKTRVTPSLRGSQVSYIAPDGQIFLWYPGNTTIARGRWSVEATGGYVAAAGRPVERHSMCFDYGGSRPGFLAGDAAMARCVPVETLLRRSESVDGDVFGLSRRARVPFDLPPQPTNLRALQDRLSRP